MNRTFIYTTPFRRNWTAMGLDDNDLYELENKLLSNPQLGDVIQETSGARKLRIKLEGRGSSGGGRVIYVDIIAHNHLYMLAAYPKNVQSDLTPEQKKIIRKIVEAIKKEEFSDGRPNL